MVQDHNYVGLEHEWKIDNFKLDISAPNYDHFGCNGK